MAELDPSIDSEVHLATLASVTTAITSDPDVVYVSTPMVVTPEIAVFRDLPLGAETQARVVVKFDTRTGWV